MQGQRARVFISYSHDSAEHRKRVLSLAERLRADGVDAQIDQYVQGTPLEGWARWMRNQLASADFILLVCTETYYRRFCGQGGPGQGRGVDWEGMLVTLELYHAQSRTAKFVPVIFVPSEERFVPEELSGHTHYLLTSEDQYFQLYAFLTGQAGVVPGELGTMKALAREPVAPLRFGRTGLSKSLASKLSGTLETPAYDFKGSGHFQAAIRHGPAAGPHSETNGGAVAPGSLQTTSVPSSQPVAASRRRPLPLAAMALAALLFTGLVGGSLWFFGPASVGVTRENLRAPSSPKPATAADLRRPLKAGRPWTNSLEMRFVPLGRIHMAVWQTRVRDFEAFAKATGYDAVDVMSSAITRDGLKLTTMSWKNPGFTQTPEHPVVGVSWEDAVQFCAWLTKEEQSQGILTGAQNYRLPTDQEWSQAVGLADAPGATPEARSGKVDAVYPWGRTFPPPVDAANYAGSESSAGAPEWWAVIAGFHDAFPRTAPVAAFKSNACGLCSVGGNVWEWCMEKFNDTTNWRTLRGGSWATSREEEMLSSYRRGYEPFSRCDDVGFRCVITERGGPG
jgi:formylglycine-generating enzyme required for sulfatase activity